MRPVHLTFPAAGRILSRKGGGVMAVYLTGDTHGDFSRFKTSVFQEQKSLTKADYMIICGDFGGVWNQSKEQQYWLDWLEDKPYTTLFVTGNHENYDLLAAYPTDIWHGGVVQRIRPSVLHLTRGQIFELAGKRFFTMGGASCHDVQDGILEPDDPFFKLKYLRLMKKNAYFRVNHLSWWKEELPSAEEYRTARETLDRANWDVDYIITHCAPTSIQAIAGNPTHTPNALTDFLEEVSQKCRFKLWFFGHYHNGLVIKQKYILLYHEIVQLLE